MKYNVTRIKISMFFAKGTKSKLNFYMSSTALAKEVSYCGGLKQTDSTV